MARRNRLIRRGGFEHRIAKNLMFVGNLGGVWWAISQCHELLAKTFGQELLNCVFKLTMNTRI
jgi:hypothetical protein